MASVDLKSAETLGRAALEKTPSTGLTPEQQLAKKIKDEASKKGPHSTLEDMRSPRTPDQTKVEHYLEDHFYSKIDADGKKDREGGSRAETRFNQAKAAEAAGRKFIEHGWDPTKLNTNEQKFIKDSVKAVIESWPDGKAFIDSLPVASRSAAVDTMIIDMLQNPDMKPAVQKIFAGVFDEAKIREHITTEAGAKLAREKAKQSAIDGEITIITGKITTNATELGEYDPTKTKGKDLAKLDSEAALAQHSQAEAKSKIDDINSNIATNQSYLRRLNPSHPSFATDKKTLEDEISLLKGEKTIQEKALKEATDKLVQRQLLIQEKQQLQEERKRLSEEKAALEKQKDDIDDAVNRANTEFASQQSRHEKTEEQIVNELQSVFTDAAREYLIQKVTKLETARQELIDKEAKEKEESKDKVSDDEKKLGKYLDNYWMRDISNRGALKKWWNPNNKEFDRKGINTSYKEMITAGPDQVLWQLLRGSDSTKFPNRTAAETWINDPANSAVVERMRVQVAEQLITRRLQTGSITEGDARFIASSTWGKDAIDVAIKRKSDIQTQINKLKESGIIKGNVGEWVYEQVRKNPVFWLSLIFGSAAFSAIGSAVIGAGLLTTASFAGAGGVLMTGGLAGAKHNLS